MQKIIKENMFLVRDTLQPKNTMKGNMITNRMTWNQSKNY